MKSLDKVIQCVESVDQNMNQFLISCPSALHTKQSGTKCFKNFQKSACSHKLVFENIRTDSKTLTQFILDPTSFNLKERVHVSDPVVPAIFKLSRDYCMAIHTERLRRLQQLVHT